jgi:hypothetical protein
MLTTREFAAITGLKPYTVSSYCKRGMIPEAVFDTRLNRWMIPASAHVIVGKRGRPPKVKAPA